MHRSLSGRACEGLSLTQLSELRITTATSVNGLVAFDLQNDMGHAEDDNPIMMEKIYAM